MQQHSDTRTSLRLSTKSGPLAQIWLASNMTMINRNVAKTDIVESVQEIAKVAGVNAEDSSLESITLRASGELLHGVVKVYSQQASFLLGDISDLLAKVKSIFKGNVSKAGTLKVDTVARIDQLLLEDAVTELDVLVMPSLDFLEDVEIPAGLLQGERSMERQVQGAAAGSQMLADQAAWDVSLEVGRRFLQEDLGQQDTSHLDLNFDLGESNQGTNTKSWGEGTNNMDDDLPPVTDDWDLALNEEIVGDQDAGGRSAYGSEGSIEVGRRAELDTTLQDDSHLDIDLGLPKDFNLDKENEDVYGEREILQVEPIDTRVKRRRSKKNEALINVKKVIFDDKLELADSDVKEGPSSEILVDDSAERSSTTTSSKKRSIQDLINEESYLPSSIKTHLLQPDWKKKQRTLVQSHQEDSELDLDISLGIDESLVPVSDPLDHQQDIGSDITIGVQDHAESQDIDERTMDINDYSGIEQDDFSAETNTSENDKNNKKIEIKTGQMVSKSTMEMANLLRDNLHDGISSFDSVLKRKYDSEPILSRDMASSTFFELLSLATADCIKLSQEDTFSEIIIESKSNLYEKFVPA